MSEERFFPGFSGVAGFSDQPILPSERHYGSTSFEDPRKIGIGQVRIPSIFAKCRLQTEWEKRTARISYNLERRFSHAQEDAQAIHRPGEGRHPSASSPRTRPRLGSV